MRGSLRHDGLIYLYRAFGPVVNAGPGGRGVVYLLGPEANRFIFANSHLFRWREAFEVLVPVDGETSLIVSDGEDHKRRRRLVQPAFHHRKISDYAAIISDIADEKIETFRRGDVVDAYAEFRAVIRRSTLHALFGPELAADEEFFGQCLQPLLDLVDHLPPVVTAHKRLNSPLWRRAMKARERLDERIYAEIRKARADGGPTILGSLAGARDEEGEVLTDGEVRDQAVSLIAAGYETTSALMAWTIYGLLGTPGVWARAREEVKAGRTTYLRGIVNEALRLHPPGTISARKVVRDFAFDSRRVRAGKFLIYSPYVTHRLPEVWPDPLRFDPLRWDPDAPNHRKPGPHEFLPFGGGPHRCIGATLATTEVTVILERILAGTVLRPIPQVVRPVGYAAMRPRDGLRVRIG